MYAVVDVAGVDAVSVIDNTAAGAHEAEVPVHGVLVKAEEKVELVAVAVDLLVRDADGEEDVAATDDGLVSVVGIEVEAAADKDAGENVARGCDALTGLTADTHGKIVLV